MQYCGGGYAVSYKGDVGGEAAGDGGGTGLVV